MEARMAAIFWQGDGGEGCDLSHRRIYCPAVVVVPRTASRFRTRIGNGGVTVGARLGKKELGIGNPAPGLTPPWRWRPLPENGAKFTCKIYLGNAIFTCKMALCTPD